MTNANIYIAASFVVTALDGELWIALLLMGVGAVYLAHARFCNTGKRTNR